MVIVCFVQKSAGEAVVSLTREYQKARRNTSLEEAKDVWEGADMVVKVKEPLEPEISLAEVWPGPFYVSPSRGECGVDSKIDGASDCRIGYETVPGGKDGSPSSSPTHERDCGEGCGPCGGTGA